MASPVTDITPTGQAATGNMLDSVVAPSGTTAVVSGFTAPGSNTVYPAGSTVTIVAPRTGTVTGSMQINPGGSYVFKPALGYVGPVPSVDVIVASSDGQSKQVPLTVSVNPIMTDASESPVIVAGSNPLQLNVLSNAVLPPGATANVTSFSLPGSSIVYPAGATPVTVVDPVSGRTAGTVVMQPNGDVILTFGVGFTGQAPAISYTVQSNDGQVSPGALAVTVLPGEGGTKEITRG